MSRKHSKTTNSLGLGEALQGPRRGVFVFNGAGNKVGHSEAPNRSHFPGCTQRPLTGPIFPDAL